MRKATLLGVVVVVALLLALLPTAALAQYSTPSQPSGSAAARPSSPAPAQPASAPAQPAAAPAQSAATAATGARTGMSAQATAAPTSLPRAGGLPTGAQPTIGLLALALTVGGLRLRRRPAAR